MDFKVTSTNSVWLLAAQTQTTLAYRHPLSALKSVGQTGELEIHILGRRRQNWESSTWYRLLPAVKTLSRSKAYKAAASGCQQKKTTTTEDWRRRTETPKQARSWSYLKESLHYLPHLSWASTFWFWTARENNNIAPRTHPVHCNALGVWLCSGGSASSSSVALTCLCANQTHTAPRRELALGTGIWDRGSWI